MSYTYQTLKHWCSFQNLEHSITDNMELGWLVLYVVPLPIQPGYNSFSAPAAPASYVTIQPDGAQSINLFIPATHQPSNNDQYEICFYRREGHGEPCPRCSYPLPDDSRLDREV